MKISITVLPNTIIDRKIIIIITAKTIFILAIVAISSLSIGVATHQLFPEGLMISQLARCRSSFCNLSCITQIGGRPIEEVIIVIVIKRDEEAAGFLQNENCTKHRLVMVGRSAGPMCGAVFGAKSGQRHPFQLNYSPQMGTSQRSVSIVFPVSFFLNAQYRYQIQSQYKCPLWTIAYIALYSFFL